VVEEHMMEECEEDKRKVGEKQTIEAKCTSSEIGVRHAIVNITSSPS